MGISNFLRKLRPNLPGFNAVSLPSQAEAYWLTESVKHSPDLGWLEQFEFQLLFVPDTNRVSCSHYDLVSDGAHLCTGFTERLHEYWFDERITGIKEGGDVSKEIIGIPVPVKQQSMLRWAPPALRIKGEVHAIRPWQFQKLDEYKQNRHVFVRQRVNILVPYAKLSNDPADFERPIPRALEGKGYCFLTEEKVQVVRCWMYVANLNYWNDLLTADTPLKPVRNFESRKKRPWLTRYYDFPRRQE